MTKELIAYTWCDNHADDEERVEGSPYRITLGSLAPREIDLCDQCHNELLKPLVDLLRDVGQPLQDVKRQPQQRRKVPADGPCPDCGAEFPTAQGLGMHRNRMHGYRAGDDA